MELQHGRVPIALHLLAPARDGDACPPLLLLHELGSSGRAWPEAWLDWPGGVHGLDFAGHGASGWIAGAGYYPEFLLADADLALAALGERVCLVGAGIGAYVALLLAGARPAAVPAAALLSGRGLMGGGTGPDPDHPRWDLEALEAQRRELSAGYAEGTDPLVCLCENDLRPLDYVEPFANAATRLLLVSGDAEDARPPWWQVAAAARGARDVDADPAAVLKALREALQP